MQLFMATTDDLKPKVVDLSNVVHLEILIGSVKFRISEREGALRVSVDGQLVAMPTASNMMTLSSAP